MTTEVEIKEKFWKAIRSDMTVMLGLVGAGEHSQPMTAQFDGDGDHGPFYFFTATDTELAQSLGAGQDAMAQFVSKGHDLFACIHGRLVPDNDRAIIDRLWNKWVAAWFEGGKDDPKLLLLRFEPDDAQVWLNANSLVAGMKMLLGRDPKKDYADKTAEVRLN